MSESRSILGLITACALLFLGATAPQTGKRRVYLGNPTVVAGQYLAAGSYELRWTSSRGSDQVELQVLKGRKVVLSAKGRFAPRPVPADYDGTLDRYRDGGEREILGICFAGVTEVIEIDAGATASSTAAP